MWQIISVSTNHIAEHRLPSKLSAGPASRFEVTRQHVAATSSGSLGVRVGDHLDFLAPVLFDELGGHQDIPHANIADDLKYK